MGKKMPIGLFVAQLVEAEKRHDGYIMGATGQNPKKWATTSWWFTQYTGSQKTKALYWREHAARVWDCNGLAEGLYKDYTGIDINSKARYNYSQWCGVKGEGKIPKGKKIPGAAVFIHSSSAGYITHVGYLVEPVKKGDTTGDWYVIEARGVMYGVVRTKLSDRGWNRWGYMTKYFDYSEQGEIEPPKMLLGDRLLKNGCEGDDVTELQTHLIELRYSCGKWGADGDFGDATEMAVRDFQKDHGLVVDGEYGEKSHAAMVAVLEKVNRPVDEPKTVEICGGNCYARSAPTTQGAILGVAYSGEEYTFAGKTSDAGWHLIDFDGKEAWVSGKYSKVVG